MERRQASRCARIPELDLVVLGPGNQQSLGRVPITGLDVPVMPSKNRIRGPGGEIENLEGGIVGCRKKFAVARGPRQIPNRIVMRIIYRLDVVEIRPPVLDVALLSTRYSPVLAVRPSERRHSSLQLVIVGLSTESVPPSNNGHRSHLDVSRKEAQSRGIRTSITVSKLNAVPFHSMNSPVWPPVNRRRPSGVHLTTVIGFFDLPIDWCKCRTGMLSAGECTRAMGGAICWKKTKTDGQSPGHLQAHGHDSNPHQ